MPPLNAERTPASALTDLLERLAEQLAEVGLQDYRTRPAHGLTGSIGGHVRHCLDHVGALVAAHATGRVDYDARERDTEVERWPGAALAEIARLERTLAALPEAALEQPVELVAALDEHGTSLTARSTFGRELAFVISHTIHHFAVIALLLKSRAIDVPPRFGHAPSTPADASTRYVSPH